MTVNNSNNKNNNHDSSSKEEQLAICWALSETDIETIFSNCRGTSSIAA